MRHECLRRLSEEVPGALLHFCGHLHTFSDQTFKRTRYVNVAALDRPVSARPRGKAKWGKEDCRNFNAGNYTVIEIGSQDMKIRCVNLAHDYPDWIPLDDRRYNGIAWIPEEARWTKASDPPLRQYEMSRSPLPAKSHAPAESSLMPFLAIDFPVFDPIAISIGPIAIRWYALAYIGGIVLGWIYAPALIKNEKLWSGPETITLPQLDDFILWVTVGIILGGRTG